MSDNVTAIKGLADLFSPDSDAFTHMEAVARETFSRYGFTELYTPILERTELFCWGIGMEADVVQKEMYAFPDRKDRSLTLHPEAAVGVMRVYIESGRSGDAVIKLSTIGPMFRYECPRKGRVRQFHQINCECLEPSEPYADAELITIAICFLEALGLKDLSLQLNSLGCPTCRPAYRETLHKWLPELDESALCKDYRRHMVTNPLCVLDCKVPSCREHTTGTPKVLDHNCSDCAARFEAVRRLLDTEKVPYVTSHRPMHGLGYYTRTTLKIASDQIGAQGTVAGDGRYDGLVEQLGGPDVSGLGFTCGMECLTLLSPQPEAGAGRPGFFTTVLTDVARDAAYALTQVLRDAGFHGEMGSSSRSIKSAVRQAGKSGAYFRLLTGEDEPAAQTVMLRNMDSGEQSSVASVDVVVRLQK